MSQSRIRLERVTKRWGTTSAVDEISFEVTPGQFVIPLGLAVRGPILRKGAPGRWHNINKYYNKVVIDHSAFDVVK